MLKFYCYPRWKTCQKAKAWLSDNGVEFDYIDLVKNPPEENELKNLAKLANEEIDKLLNKKSKAYKELDVDVNSLSDDDLAKTLINNPKAIKRPIITDGEKALIGFDENKIKETFSV